MKKFCYTAAIISLLLITAAIRIRSELNREIPVESASEISGGSARVESGNSVDPGEMPAGHNLKDMGRGIIANVQDTANIPGKESKNSPASTPTQDGDNYFLTYDQLKYLEHMTFLDQITTWSILRKLDKSQRKEALNLANGGITVGELQELNEILSEKLSAKDFKKLNSLIRRYMTRYATKD